MHAADFFLVTPAKVWVTLMFSLRNWNFIFCILQEEFLNKTCKKKTWLYFKCFFSWCFAKVLGKFCTEHQKTSSNCYWRSKDWEIITVTVIQAWMGLKRVTSVILVEPDLVASSLICTFQKSNKYGLYLSDLQVSRHSMYITNLVCHIQWQSHPVSSRCCQFHRRSLHDRLTSNSRTCWASWSYHGSVVWWGNVSLLPLLNSVASL